MEREKTETRRRDHQDKCVESLVGFFMLTYSVATWSCCPGGVYIPTQQFCEGPSDQFIQETVHGRLEGLIH